MSFSNPFIKRVGTLLFQDWVEPVKGSIIYRKLWPAEHTGIYVGNKLIVELDGSGRIELVTYREFCNGNPFCQLYVACNKNGQVLYKDSIYQRAMELKGESRDYNLILDNCHQFTSGCITGDFENSDNFFFSLVNTIKKEFGTTMEWRATDNSW